MRDINLVTRKQPEVRIPASYGLIAVASVFVLELFLWGSILAWKKNLKDKIEKTQNEYNVKYHELTNGHAKEVVDFQNRLSFAERYQTGNTPPKETLDEIKRALLASDVWLKSYKYEKAGKKISLVCQAKNYNLVAQQILSFKKFPYFSAVTSGATQKDSQTKIVLFDVDLAL